MTIKRLSTFGDCGLFGLEGGRGGGGGARSLTVDCLGWRGGGGTFVDCGLSGGGGWGVIY